MVCFGQGGTVEKDWANAVAVSEDGSVVIAGISHGDFAWLDKSSHRLGGDFLAIKLDSEGAEMWRWQVRTINNGRYVYPILF